MKLLDRTKLIADIAKVASETYGLLVDKARSTAADKARIVELERRLDELKASPR